jgi:hypothetical protein
LRKPNVRVDGRASEILGDSRLPATTDRILALSPYSTAVVIDNPIDVIDHKEIQSVLRFVYLPAGAVF